MLLAVVLTSLLFSEVYCDSANDGKPCSFPLPLGLPTRNDRAEQCWLRIEDSDLVETIAIFCFIAHGFLRNYIHDYNSHKMLEDKVDVSLWSENARPQEDIVVPKTSSNPKDIVDWKLKTVLDPVTHMRLYVTNNADCRLIMYSRDGTSNYKMKCEPILFYLNERMQSGTVRSRADHRLLSICIFLVILSINIV